MKDLDAIDRKILRLLQHDSKRTSQDIADAVGLSQTPCLRRIKALEQRGVIDRYVAIVNPATVGLNRTVFARVWLTGQDARTVNRFTDAVRRLPEVVECHLMAGDCDFLLRVLARDMESYRQFQIDHLTSIPGVQSVKSDVPMQQIKASTEIPV